MRWDCWDHTQLQAHQEMRNAQRGFDQLQLNTSNVNNWKQEMECS